MSELVTGFAPFADGESEVLILGSFPSVKSRAQNFYYGNPQNAFWRILAAYFNEQTPKTVADKQSLLRRRHIALWDIVTECEIVGSQDSTIKHFKVANLQEVFTNSPIKAIIINGGKAYEVFAKYYKDLSVLVYKLPSTSPANTRRKDDEWFTALQSAFSAT